MWQLLTSGVVLGLSAGVAPGPLMTMAVGQTLRYGPREGVKIAIVPPLTDVPLILVAAVMLQRLTQLNLFLGIISIIGGLFVGWLGVQSFREVPQTEAESDESPGSLRKGIIVNLLSPHPYVFWLTVGVPIMLKSGRESYLPPVIFALAFFVCLCGSKLVIVGLVSRSRNLLQGRGYRLTLRVLGVCLIGFALLLLIDGSVRF